tara:strand:- start:4265 stop:5227 length:963 start_codon:yes stop_codon:yes gene_type:complete
MDKQLLVQQLLVGYRGVEEIEPVNEQVVTEPANEEVTEPVKEVKQPVPELDTEKPVEKEKTVPEYKLEYDVKNHCFPMMSMHKLWIFPRSYAEYEKLAITVNECRSILKMQIGNIDFTGFLNRLKHEPNILCLDRLRINSAELLDSFQKLTTAMSTIHKNSHRLEQLYAFFDNFNNKNATHFTTSCSKTLKKHGYSTFMKYSDLYKGLSIEERKLFDELQKQYDAKKEGTCKDFKTRADLLDENEKALLVTGDLIGEKEKLTEENAKLTEENAKLTKELAKLKEEFAALKEVPKDTSSSEELPSESSKDTSSSEELPSES